MKDTNRVLSFALEVGQHMFTIAVAALVMAVFFWLITGC